MCKWLCALTTLATMVPDLVHEFAASPFGFCHGASVCEAKTFKEQCFTRSSLTIGFRCTFPLGPPCVAVSKLAPRTLPWRRTDKDAPMAPAHPQLYDYRPAKKRRRGCPGHGVYSNFETYISRLSVRPHPLPANSQLVIGHVGRRLLVHKQVKPRPWFLHAQTEGLTRTCIAFPIGTMGRPGMSLREEQFRALSIVLRWLPGTLHP